MSDINSVAGLSDLLKQSGASSGSSSAPVKLTETKTADVRLSDKMHEIDISKKEVFAQDVAARLKLRYVDLRKFPILPDSLALIPEEDARKYHAVPFFADDASARIGVVSIEDTEVQKYLGSVARDKKIKLIPYVISEESFEHAMHTYAALPKIINISREVTVSQADLDRFATAFNSLPELAAKIKDVNTTDFIALIFSAAFKMDASDIHIEAEEDKIVVRLRLDGVLNEIGDVPHEMWKKIIGRIKLLSGLKINVDDKPQDGRISLVLNLGKIDVRVSTIPTAFGESVVMRILRPQANTQLEQLGIRGTAFEALLREIERPNGMVITTGPTGSGKTTSLYTILKRKNQPGVKIITLEDPIEYNLEGINQSQIDQSKGYTYADALKSVLRQDPDICMVGEIRDLPTAEVAIQAALTGHLLLSTIHTNSASGAIPRFLSMGVKPFLLAPALNAIIGQRLIRKLCDVCKVVTPLTDAEKARATQVMSTLTPKAGISFSLDNAKFYTAPGCEACNKLGYKGRVGIYEIFTMTPAIEKLILTAQMSEFDIQKQAIDDGMVTMAQDGILKAAEGISSISEVFRVSE
ncbi:MAG: GspE/PulE family protein [Candidatus Magasanikbacteria bacterium]|nr:GspE/PulE family protein [Candidatus Magasanikbacteria bacterium]